MNITSTRKTYKVYMDWQRKKERKKNEENNAEKKKKYSTWAVPSFGLWLAKSLLG